MLISLVICTYNREEILKVTLPSLLELIIPNDVELEVIIVDNNSNDNTSNFVKEFIARSNMNISYVFESIQGLSQARNTGYMRSKGEYIVYIDDECILPKKWLKEAVIIINNESPAFLGGPYFGKYLPGDDSPWFKESYGDSYIIQYGLPNGSMQGKYLSGGNLFVRRDVFQKIGLFDVELGMDGETINYGEEVDFQKRFIEATENEVIWYDEKVFLWHSIRSEKMSMWFLFKDALIRGASTAELQISSAEELRKAPYQLSYSMFLALRSYFVKLFYSLIYNKNFFGLLYDDYKDSTWKNIGGSWYKVKQLLRR